MGVTPSPEPRAYSSASRPSQDHSGTTLQATLAGAGEYQWGPLCLTGRARRVRLPLGAIARSQEHCREAMATSEWSVTTKKCHTAGIMVRRPLYFKCAQNMWANLLERQFRISSTTDDEINLGAGDGGA